MKVIAFLTEPKSIKAILDHASLPSTGPPIAPARLPDFYFDAA
jgi:hypothetical protein